MEVNVMSHMIERNEDMFSTRVQPWHGLGTILPEAPTSREAIIYAGLDWGVTQVPALRHFQGSNYPGPVDNYLFNVRSDTDRTLGIVTDRYKIVQNREAFDFADALTNTGEVTYETAGCLEGGKRVWLLAQLPPEYILGDEIARYFCFTHGHDGQTPINCFFTADRVVCHNTLTMALRNAKRKISIKHTGDVQEKMKQAMVSLKMANDYTHELKMVAEIRALKTLGPVSLDKVVTNLFPMPDEATKRTQTGVLNQRNELLFRYNNAPDLADFRGTQWGLIAAVSDYETHAPPLRMTEGFQEKRFMDLMNGTSLMDKTIKILDDIAA